MVNVNATNIVKNKSQRDKLVNLLHLLCHVTNRFKYLALFPQIVLARVENFKILIMAY